MSIFSKLFGKKPENTDIIVLSEQEGKERIKKWKDILSKQDEAIDKIENGLKLGKSWVSDLPTRIDAAKKEGEAIKSEMKVAGTEERLLSLGKKYISKDRLIKQLTMTEKAMIGNLRMADLQYNRLQDRAIELATKIQESEVYLSMAGSLQLARQYIEDIEQPVNSENIESIANFKSVSTKVDEKDISDAEVKQIFRKEFNRVARGNDKQAVRKNRTTKKDKAKVRSARK